MKPSRSIFFGIIMLFISSGLYAQQYKKLVEQAMEYTMKDSLVQAEQLYKEALKSDPNSSRNALIFSNLGSVQHRMGKADEAIQSYTLALNITPYATSILLNRAAVYMEKGNTEKAYVDYCNVIDLLPDNVEARLFRAYIYMGRRQYNEARIDYNRILSTEFSHKSARLGLVMLNEKEGKLLAARDGIDVLIQDYPRETDMLKIRANIQLAMELPDAALVDLEKAESITPDDADIYVMKGDVYLHMERKADARKAFLRAVELGVPPVQIRERISQCK